MAKLNKKLIWILVSVLVVLIVAGGIVAYLYKFQDPVPHLEEGVKLKTQAEQLESQIALEVADIQDPCALHYSLQHLREERTDDYWRDCIRSLQKAVQHSRSNVAIRLEALHELADVYMQRGNYQGWRSAWNAILEEDRTNYDAARTLADYFYEFASNFPREGWHQVWSEVRTRAEGLLELKPDDMDARLMLADAILKQYTVGLSRDVTGDIERINELLQEVMADDEGNVQACRQLAELAMVRADRAILPEERRQFQEQALQLLTTAIEANPDDPDAYFNLMQYYLFPVVDSKYQLVMNVTGEAERTAVIAAAQEYAQQALESVVEMTERFPQDARFKTGLSRVLLRTGITYDALTQAIDLVEASLDCPNADIVWCQTLADYYRRRSEFTTEPQPDLQSAFNVLWKLLYDPQVFDPDVFGPRGESLRQLRFNSMQLMIDVATKLASLTDDQAQHDNYLQIARGYLTEFQETLGEEELVVQILKGTVQLTEGNWQEGVRTLFHARQAVMAAGARDARLDMKLFRALRGGPYNDLAIIFGQSAITSGLNSPGNVLEYLQVVALNPLPGQLEEVLDMMNAFEEKYAGDSRILNDVFYMIKAESLLRLGRYAEAAQALDEVQDRSARWQSLRAQSYETPEQRVAALEEYVTDYPDDLGAIMALYRYYIPLGAEDPSYYDRAQEMVDTALTLQPDNIGLLRMQRRLEEDDPNNITAERDREILLDILSNIQDDFQRESQLGAYYAALAESTTDEQVARESLTQARSHYEAAQAAATGDQTVLRELFSLVLADEDWTRARQLLSGAGSEIDQLEFEADLAIAQEQWTNAIAILNQYLDYRPVSVRAYISLAQAYYNLNQIDQAVAAARQAVQLQPRSVPANRVLALTLNTLHQQIDVNQLTEDDLTEVIRASDIVAAQDPTYRELGFRLVYYPALANYYGRYLRTLPAGEETNQIRSQYLQKINQLYSGAIMVCAALINDNPSDVENWLRLAGLYSGFAQAIPEDQVQPITELNNLAKEAYEQAIAENPTEITLRSSYSLFLRSLGEEQAAQQVMDAMMSDAQADNITEARLQRSQLHMIANELPQAEALLNEVLTEEPENRQAQAMLADVYLGTDRYLEAANVFRDMRGDEVDETLMSREAESLIMAGAFDQSQALLDQSQAELGERVWIVMLRAKQARIQGEYDRAIALSDRALQLAEDDNARTVANMLKAESLYAAGRLEEALTVLLDLRSTLPAESNLGRSLLAQIYWQTNRQREAVTELEVALNNTPEDDAIRARLARLLEIQQRWNNLERIYLQALEMHPDSLDWHLDAGQMYLRRMQNAIETGDRNGANQYGSQAIPLLSRALELARAEGRRQVEAASLLATVLRQAGRYQQALDRIAENLTGQPIDAILLLRRAEVLYAMGRQANALSTLEEALGLVSDSPALRDMFLSGVAGVGDVQTLIDWGQQKLAQRPDWRIMRLLLANLYYQTGNVQMQIQVLEPALQDAAAEDLIRIYPLLAVSYSQVGRIDDAVQIYHTLLETSPNNPNYVNNLAYLLLGQRGYEAEAIAMAERAYGLAPDNAHIMDTYALALLQQQRYEEALQISDRALASLLAQEVVINGEFYLHRAQAAIGLERYLEAYEDLLMALDSPLDQGTREIVQELINGLPAEITGAAQN
ncbi:MAG: tetratricopeptide repeat protein [Sedimentisphaerales bacterium]|nr:tetratricopeptide repeat protein [Sedimentisphaerales bacterium]